jgi:hypothetical protein
LFFEERNERVLRVACD